jgi:hypothetical protein
VQADAAGTNDVWLQLATLCGYDREDPYLKRVQSRVLAGFTNADADSSSDEEY